MDSRTVVQSAITAGCAYEILAIVSREKVPTISTLCRQHRWAEALFLGWLIVHLHRRREDLLIEQTRQRFHRRIS